jgi:mannitol/fructose-specific phosphotransferase system IIA component (Ntr-type)
VLLWHEPIEKEAATRQLLAACCRENKKISEPAAWEALLERERQGSTFLGDDVALPHARLSGLEAAVVGIGVAAQGVREPSTGKSVRIVFLLLSPTHPPEVHVRLLSRVSKLAQHHLLRQELANTSNAEEAARIIEEHMAALDRSAAEAPGRKAV